MIPTEILKYLNFEGSAPEYHKYAKNFQLDVKIVPCTNMNSSRCKCAAVGDRVSSDHLASLLSD